MRLEDKLKGEGEKRDLVRDTKELYGIVSKTYGGYTENMALSYVNTYMRLYNLELPEVIENIGIYENETSKNQTSY